MFLQLYGARFGVLLPPPGLRVGGFWSWGGTKNQDFRTERFLVLPSILDITLENTVSFFSLVIKPTIPYRDFLLKRLVSNFFIHISLQPDGVNLCCFRLRLFDATEFIVWNNSFCFYLLRYIDNPFHVYLLRYLIIHLYVYLHLTLTYAMIAKESKKAKTTLQRKE